MDVVYLDFQKALDKVPIKLKAYGIGESMIIWIQAWSTDKRQRVIVEGDIANWKPVLRVVP